MTALVAVPAKPGQRGVDMVTMLTAASATALKAAGMEFVGRYLGSLSAAEAAAITGAGLNLTLICYSHAPGYEATAELGQSDGANAVRHASQIPIPQGCTIWIDSETWAKGSDIIGYIDAMAKVIQSAGYEAGLYVGFDDYPMTPEQLYALAVVRYWHSCSIVPAVARRGYSMVQSAPNSWVAGVQVDVDVVQADMLGDVPTFVAAATTTIA
jgi:hypothetical protein